MNNQPTQSPSRRAPGPRPTHAALVEAPTPGPLVVTRVDANGVQGRPSVQLLGWGRCKRTVDGERETTIHTRDEWAAYMRETVLSLKAEMDDPSAFTGNLHVSRQFDRVSDAVDAYGEDLAMCKTARRLLAAERAQAEYDEAVAAWNRAVEESDEEICDHCGGAGGASCWPGFTCYECGGRGTTAA